MVAPIVIPSHARIFACCSARGQECSADDFWFLNSCKALRQHFACELGCATEMGPDMPSYVEDETLSTFHQCLVREAVLFALSGMFACFI